MDLVFWGDMMVQGLVEKNQGRVVRYRATGCQLDAFLDHSLDGFIAQPPQTHL